MNDLEFEYVLRDYVARARNRIITECDEQSYHIIIEFNNAASATCRWRVYISRSPSTDIYGADLMKLVDTVAATHWRIQANKELTALPRPVSTEVIEHEPANPDNTPKENVNAGITEETVDD